MQNVATYLVPLLAGAVGLLMGQGACRLVERDARGALRQASRARRMLSGLACGLSFAALANGSGVTPQLFELCSFAAILLYLTLTDLDRFEIPNGCVLAALAVRLVYLLVSWALGWMAAASLAYYLLSGVFVGVVLLVTVLVADGLFGGESMGGGDLKLFAVAALYVGWEQSLLLVALACVLGIASTVVLRSLTGRSKVTGLTTFPFGPAIALATVIVLIG